MVLNDIIDVMAVDALTSSHPLSSKEEDIMTPEDISQLFDSITYSKVQFSFLSMIYCFLHGPFDNLLISTRQIRN